MRVFFNPERLKRLGGVVFFQPRIHSKLKNQVWDDEMILESCIGCRKSPLTFLSFWFFCFVLAVKNYWWFPFPFKGNGQKPLPLRLLLIITFIFSIAFLELSSDTPLEQLYFQSIPTLGRWEAKLSICYDTPSNFQNCWMTVRHIMDMANLFPAWTMWFWGIPPSKTYYFPSCDVWSPMSRCLACQGCDRFLDPALHCSGPGGFF